MVGETLAELRRRVEALASESGTHYVVCGRTGEQPVPVEGLRFSGRDRAREALAAAERYRETLRRYDPRTPYHDLIVCEAATPPPGGDGRSTARSGVPSGPDREGGPASTGGRRAEFCHRVAGVVFEALSAGPYGDVERAVLERYFDLAETVADPDDLCLCLLEGLAAEFAERLSPGEQADLLAAAAGQLPAAPTDEPVAATLARLRDCGLVDAFDCDPVAFDRTTRAWTVHVRLSGYVLSVRDGRLPVLPMVVELYRHRPAWPVAAVRVVDTGDGWRLALELDAGSCPDALASVPVG